jgi:hypothetical protein
MLGIQLSRISADALSTDCSRCTAKAPRPTVNASTTANAAMTLERMLKLPSARNTTNFLNANAMAASSKCDKENAATLAVRPPGRRR